MQSPPVLLLGSIDAVRPVFMIVMGIFLMVIAWRLAKASGGWTARIIVAGALLLGFGYALLLPMQEAGLIQTDKASATGAAWIAVKLITMNIGWLLFGTGIAMHARLFTAPARKPATAPALATHESIA